MARGGIRYGAGRPGWRVKAENCLQLDVRRLAQRSLLAGGSFTWCWTDMATGKEVAAIGIKVTDDRVRLNFSASGQPVTQDFAVLHTRCNYGGTRPWFGCPRCGRRVAVLFLRGSNFVCRHCGRISYASQSEDLIGRTWLKQRKLEKRLGEGWARPRRMHHRTCERLLDRIWQCEERREMAVAMYMHRLALLHPGIDLLG